MRWAIASRKELKMRKEVNAIVRNYAQSHDGSYRESWNRLYKFYNSVVHQNIKSRATRRHIKPLDVVEQEGNLEIIKILAENLFVA